MVVFGTIDERVINMKRMFNFWERNENYILCFNLVKVIGCIVVNIGI